MKAALSPKNLAQAIGISESSLKRWADDGQIRVMRTAGGHRRIAVEEAVRFIREIGIPLVQPDALGLGKLMGTREGAATHRILRGAVVPTPSGWRGGASARTDPVPVPGGP